MIKKKINLSLDLEFTIGINIVLKEKAGTKMNEREFNLSISFTYYQHILLKCINK